MSHERSRHSLADPLPVKDEVLSEATDLNSLLAAIIGEPPTSPVDERAVKADPVRVIGTETVEPADARAGAHTIGNGETAAFSPEFDFVPVREAPVPGEIVVPHVPSRGALDQSLGDLETEFDFIARPREPQQTQTEAAIREAAISATLAAAAARSSARMRRIVLLTGAAALSGIALAGLSALAGRGNDTSAGLPTGAADTPIATPEAAAGSPLDPTPAANVSPSGAAEAGSSTPPGQRDAVEAPGAAAPEPAPARDPRSRSARSTTQPSRSATTTSRASTRVGTPERSASSAPRGTNEPADTAAAGAVPAAVTAPAAAVPAVTEPVPPPSTTPTAPRARPEPGAETPSAPAAPPAAPETTAAPPRPEAPASNANANRATTGVPQPRREPRLVERKTPEYSGAARAARITGTVEVRFTIDRAGRPTNVQAISGPGALRGAAEAAVREWRYEPAVENGAPVPTNTSVRFSFGLTPRQPQ